MRQNSLHSGDEDLLSF